MRLEELDELEEVELDGLLLLVMGEVEVVLGMIVEELEALGVDEEEVASDPLEVEVLPAPDVVEEVDVVSPGKTTKMLTTRAAITTTAASPTSLPFNPRASYLSPI